MFFEKYFPLKNRKFITCEETYPMQSFWVLLSLENEPQKNFLRNLLFFWNYISLLPNTVVSQKRPGEIQWAVSGRQRFVFVLTLDSIFPRFLISIRYRYTSLYVCTIKETLNRIRRVYFHRQLHWTVFIIWKLRNQWLCLMERFWMVSISWVCKLSRLLTEMLLHF